MVKWQWQRRTPTAVKATVLMSSTSFCPSKSCHVLAAVLQSGAVGCRWTNNLAINHISDLFQQLLGHFDAPLLLMLGGDWS